MKKNRTTTNLTKLELVLKLEASIVKMLSKNHSFRSKMLYIIGTADDKAKILFFSKMP